MSGTIRHRIHRTLCAALVTVLALVVLLPAGSAAAAPADDERGFLTLINRDRTNAGLPALVSDTRLADTSRDWSAQMRSENRMYHDPNLAQDAAWVEPAWRSVGENVGVGYGVQSLHDAFMNSPGHRANVMSGKFNRIGVGVVHDGDRIWVTVRFLEGPAIAGSTGLEPAPAPPPPLSRRTALNGDFDGDGIDDLLTYGPGGEADELWFGRGDRSMRELPVTIKGHYRPVAGDFDGNGRTDILWYAPGTATDSLWRWNGSGWSSTTLRINGTYTPLGGDFDADGVDDVLWYAPGSAADYRWYGNRNSTFTSIGTTVAGSFIPAVGDFDGNGGDDILWYKRLGGQDVIWYSTRQRGGHQSVHMTAGGNHTPFTGDFDANGTDDIFWYTPGSAADSVWFSSTTKGAYWKVAREVNGSYLPAVGDLDGDDAEDILWFSPSGAASDPLWWGTRATMSFAAATMSPLS